MTSLHKIIFLIICFSFVSFDTVKGQDEATNIIRTNLNQLFPDKCIINTLNLTSEENNTKTLAGDVSFFGTAGVQLLCTVVDKKLKTATATFPAGTSFSVGDLQRVCGTALRDVLPTSISGEWGIQLSRLELALEANGKSVEQLKVQLKSNSWKFLEFGTLKMENVQADVLYQPNASSKVTGLLNGAIVLGSTRLGVSTTVPQKKEDWIFEIDYQGETGALSIGNLLTAVGGTNLVNELLTPAFASYFSRISIPKFKLSAVPFKKELQISTDNVLGDIKLFVSGKGKKIAGHLGYSPTNDFKFSNLESSLAWLDGIQMPLSDINLIIGNQPTEFKGLRIAKGLGIQSKITLPKDLEDLLKSGGTDIRLLGKISDLKNFELGAELDLNIDLGNDVKIEKVGLGLRSKLVQQTFFMNGKMTFPVDNKTKIRFGFLVGAEPTSSSFLAGLNMEAVNGNNQASEWAEPFGVPYFSVAHLGGEVGLNPTTIIKSLALKGDLKLGKIPTGSQKDKRVKGTVDLDLDLSNPTSSKVAGTIKNSTFAQIIEAFEPSVNLSGAIRKVLESGVDNLAVDIQPANGAISVGGGISIFGKPAQMTVKADRTSGVAASGTMEAINISVGSLTILDIKGNNTPNPNFEVDLSTDPKININGSLEVLGRKANGTVVVSKDGFAMDVTGNLFNGLSMNAKLSGGSLDDLGGMYVALAMNQDLLDQVKNSVTDVIKKASGGAEKEIGEARAQLKKSKQNASEIESFFLDVGDAFLGLVNDIQGVAAVAGMAIAKGLFSTLDIKSIKFAGGVNSLNGTVNFAVEALVFGDIQRFNVGVNLNTSDAASLIASIGKAVGEGILDNLDFLGSEWEGIKGELGEYGKKFTKFMGDGIKHVGRAYEAASDFFEGVAKDLEKAWNGEKYDTPKSSAALAEVKPGIRHYSVTIDRVYINTADDGLSPGGIFTGDSRDRTLEMYGPIGIHIQGGASASKGTNAIFWSRNRTGTHNVGSGGTINVKNTKHFYSSTSATIYATIYSRLWEFDDGAKLAADDKLYGSKMITLSAVNGTQQFTIVCTESGDSPSQITVYGSVTAYPVMTSQDVRNAIMTDDTKRLETVLKKGGDLYAKDLKPLSEAVKANKLEMVKYFLANNFKPTTGDLTMAVNSSSYNREMTRRLLLRGAKPNDAILDKMVKKQDKELVAQVVSRGIKPKLEQYTWLVSKKNYELAGYLLQNGVQPTFNELKSAVQGSDLTATKLVLSKGVKSDIALLNETVQRKDMTFFNLLSTTCAPNESSLQKAVDVNSIPLFKAILAKGLSVSNSTIVTKSIDNGNMEMTKLSLEHGGNPSDGLRHAVNLKKEEYIITCLNYGGDANAVISYAVNKPDVNLAKNLIVKYNASADKLLKEAVKTKKIDFAKVALNEGKANPSLELKGVADKGNVEFTNLLLDYGADPNLAMKGMINNQKTDVLARLIGLGADVTPSTYVKTAAEKKSLPMVTLLVNNGADPNPGMPSSIKANDLAMTSYLLSQGAKTQKYLTDATCANRPNMVALLLQYNADPNMGMSCATEKNYVNIVKMLLEYGAKAEGYLVVPAQKGYLETVKLLVEYGASPQKGLSPAVNGNRTKVTLFLLQNGAIPKDLVKVPAATGNAAMVENLCAYGDNPQPGMLPAAEKGHLKVVQVLVAYNADPKPFPYIRASVVNNHPSLVDYFIKNGADATTLDNNNLSLLHLGADKRGSEQVIELLLKAGANKHINLAETTLGNTPLHIAVFVKPKKKVANLATVTLLVEAGANVNAINTKTKKGRTVLQYCKNHKPTKDYLKSKGAVLLVKKAKELQGID